MTRLVVACAVLSLALGVASALGAASGSARTFLDATGEDPDAPDITSVVVSNTAVAWPPSSRITFRIVIPNRPTLTEDMRVALWIDADDDRTTGLAALATFPGADYYVNWDPKLRRAAALMGCRATTCTSTSARTLSFSYARGATFSVRADELGDTRRFRFAVGAWSGVTGRPETGLDFTNMKVDFAPAHGAAWRYRLQLRPSRD